MIPRVFVSSTYYDLKHVRERIEKFIDNYGFEPVLFESDKVTYQHGKEIDHSAYYEVGLCHIMVLIVGGRYGSPSSQTQQEEERRKYDEDYISITRKEFETASEKNIPILIFVDKNVYAEYQTYKENQEYFDTMYSAKPTSKKEVKFKFAHVDHINVFKFVDIVKSKPIKTFERVEEIEGYIKSQLSGMFYLYLESLKRQSEDNKILDTIAELNNVTLRMNEMLTSVGREVLAKDKKEYEKVIDNQFAIMIDFFGDQLGSSIEFENELSDEDMKQIDLDRISKIIYEQVLKTDLPIYDVRGTSSERLIASRKLNKEFIDKIQKQLLTIDERLIIKTFRFRQINRVFQQKVLPFIKTPKDEKSIIERLKVEFLYMLSETPF